MFLSLSVENFSINKKIKPFSIKINQSAVYSIKTESTNIEHFFEIMSSLKSNFEGEIKLNEISIKEDLNVKKYLQKNILFLEEITLFFNLTVEENIEFFSRIWSKDESLLEFTINYFKLENIRKSIIKRLNPEDIKLINLTKMLSCPSSIWLIKKQLIDNLNEENKVKIDKLIDSRLKQNGIIITLEELI